MSHDSILAARARTTSRSVLSLGLLWAAACGTDGQTPDCGDFPGTYDIRVESRRLEVWPELVAPAGAPYYCVTLPAGYEPPGSGEGGAAGTGPDSGGAAGAPEETTDGGAAGASL